MNDDAGSPGAVSSLPSGVPCAALCLGISFFLGPQTRKPPSLPELFKQLQSEATSDQAAQQFLKLGPNNAEAREFLARKLPALIRSEPKEHPHAWYNAVVLAGEYRIIEAIPALANSIGIGVGKATGQTFAETYRLDFHPAGKALVKIGEPSVPTLARILEKGNRREKWVAYRALDLIGSPAAIGILRDHLSHESDRAFKTEIQQALKARKSTSSN